MTRSLPEALQNVYTWPRQQQITISTFDVISVLKNFFMVFLALVAAGV